MTARRTAAVIVWIGLLAAGAAASRPAWWQADTYEDFAEGKVNGLAITRDGRLILAPEFRETADSGQPYILSAAAGADGAVYFGTGHEGKVFRLDPQGKAVEVFDAEEPDIFALAVGSDGAVFAAAGPGGRIYRIDRSGGGSLLVDLKCRYVWALLAGRSGTLYAGTGVEGKIFRIQGDQPEVLYDSSQMHVLCLTPDLAGGLLAGTAPNGYVLRIAEDGKGSSLFDSPHAEVHQIQLDRYGRVHALGVGRESEESKAAAEAGIDVTALVFQKDEVRKKSRAKADTSGIDAVVVAGQAAQDMAGLYRLDKDGSVQPLWTSAQFKAFAFQVSPDGSILLGTGDRGRLYTLREDRALAVVAESGQEQVTALLPDKGESLAFSSNLGKVYRLGGAPALSGEYVSDVVDAEFPAQFGTLQPVVDRMPAGVTVELYLRCGNTAQPDEAWTAWLGPGTAATAWKVTAPAARYAQAKVVVRRQPAAAAAAGFGIEALSLAYQPQNQAPAIQALTVNPPGVVFQKPPMIPPTGEMPEYGDHSSLALPDHVQAALTKMMGAMQLPRVYKPGTLSVSWTDRDPNGDVLEYALYFRGLGDSAWTRLAGGLRQNWFNLNRDQLGDGKYQFRLVASDAPSNPPGQSREDSMISRVVTLDSQPPRLRSLEPRKAGPGWELTVEVTDELSPIYMVEYSRDGGETWAVLQTEDGLCDQLQERCRLAVPSLAPEVHLLLVRAMDYCGNLAVISPALPQ
jgi:outer membrane protein assembly factor BamB